jgi:superfamily II DNA or RNA helicase
MELIVGDVWTTIVGPYPKHIMDPVTSYLVDGYFFAPSYRKGFWDGRKRFIKNNRFATGFIDRVCAALDAHEYRYKLNDQRTFEAIEPRYALLPDLQLNVGIRSYQARLLDSALAHGRGTLKAATSSGKTEVGAAILNSIGRKSTWFTHRTNLLHQTKARLELRLGRKIGIAGDSELDIQDITIAMVQTATSCLKNGNLRPELRKHLKESEVIIGDEVHHLESDQWYDLFSELPAKWRFGLTATPDFKGPGLALCAMTGDVIDEVTVKELIDLGVCVRPRIWFAEHREPIITGKSFQTVYSQGIVNNESRNELIKQIAWVLKEERKPTLTLVKRIVHGKLLSGIMSRAGIRAEYLHGDTPTEDRERWIQDLCDGSIDNLIATVDIMGEGVDVPRIRAIINATGSKCGGSPQDGANGRLTIQIIGRGLRAHPTKEFLDYVDISDSTHKFLKAASLSRIETLESEGYSDYIGYWHEYKPSPPGLVS